MFQYTSRKIGEQMGASDRLVCAWVSKARGFLQSRPDAKSMAAAYQITRQQNGMLKTACTLGIQLF